MSQHPSHKPQQLQWQIELQAPTECRQCGCAVNNSQLQAQLEAVVTRAVGEMARITGTGVLCPLCSEEHEAEAPPSPLRELALRRRAEMAHYFATAPARIVGNDGLREPQIGSYMAVRDYFNSGRHLQRSTMRTAMPAIVEIPTGCGKTGIICAAPFGIASGRVLVITPNLTIKRNLVKSLAPIDEDGFPNEDNFFLKCGIFSDLRDLPKFVVLERGQVNYEDCLRADVVVTNVQQIQGWLRHMEPEFFDMIIVDEAHHEPADSWQRVNEAFPSAKKIYLTATPFRFDNKPIVGETVYRYRLAHAMSNGYVKNVMKVDAVVSKMTFTLQGEVREFSYDEVMAMREELWFSKGVALSEVSNTTIVERSIAIWKEKRKSGVPHQIIGAACSIRHAVQIVELYQARGLRTTHVASDGMTMEERSRRIADYEAGEYDCVVHVGILGEGYDNPNISVAAIFRPYRSLSPYVQFVGRTLRWIRKARDSRDNLAHVVSHVGLNLNFLWEYFKHETREAAILSYIDQLFFNEESGGGSDFEIEPSPELELEQEEFLTQVTSEELQGWDVDFFLPVPGLDISYIGETVRRSDIFLTTIQGQSFQQYDRVQERERKTRTLSERAPSGRSTTQQRRPRSTPEQTLPLPFNRPDIERRQYRQWLHKEVQRAAGKVLMALHIPEDENLVEYLGERDERSNYEALVRGINRRLNRLMGKEDSRGSRNDWTLAELKEARGLITQARQELLQDVKRRLQEREQGKLPF